jgi:hypothetical protein
MEDTIMSAKPQSRLLFVMLLSIAINSLSAQSPPANSQKIQAAILLDVSGSMEGLIEQAKAQLWNMVTVMGKAKCGNGTPSIEIALYEYGRTGNDVKQGYVKQLSDFTSDLDKLSAILFGLTTNGGDEYCGHVIKSSLEELKWDASANSYKVIFIAGNEDFLQGDIKYTSACEIARQKGVIVNTIYCGDKQQGIRENWNLSGECGNGSYTHIDQNAKEEDINTPYDSAMYVMNGKLNYTYVTYGYAGASSFARQAEMDVQNAQKSKKAGLDRAAVKASGALYRNSTWDLVDAYKNDTTILSNIDKKTLPDSLKNKTAKELAAVVNEKAKERGLIQDEITRLNVLRNNYIAEEKKKRATANTATLETEVEKIIREQAKRYNMVIE